jgi:beta-lactam-binding protein with PASTA domain
MKGTVLARDPRPLLIACAIAAAVAAGSASASGSGVAGLTKDVGLESSTVSASVRVPSVRGKKLPYAEVLIKRAGLRVGREDCDCTFGVVIKSNWYVCQQWPRAGKAVRRGNRVDTYSVRDMADC